MLSTCRQEIICTNIPPASGSHQRTEHPTYCVARGRRLETLAFQQGDEGEQLRVEWRLVGKDSRAVGVAEVRCGTGSWQRVFAT